MNLAVLDPARPVLLDASYAYCRLLARREARNFYYSFLVLPRAQRRSMCALYAFLRQTDDLGDGDAPIDDRRAALARWRLELDQALAGEPPDGPGWPALVDTVGRHGISADLLHTVIDGVASDLVPRRFQTFEELYHYCYQVASVVGLACLRIWGVTDELARQPAEWCGIAFQLTNILRDLREDHRRGRVYLPAEDLCRFGVDEAELGSSEPSPAFCALVNVQTQRARDFYERARPLAQFLSPPARAVLQVMCDVYSGLLNKIERSPADILKRRIELSTFTKWAYLLRALPVRFLGSPLGIDRH